MTRPEVEATEGPGHTSTPGMRKQLAPIVIGLVVVLALIVGGGLLVSAIGSEERPSRVAAPSVAVGDADAVVLATTFDGDGARNQIPSDVVEATRGVDGVAVAQGAARRFVQVYPGEGASGTASREASERSAIALSVEGSSLELQEGRLPSDASEVAVNRVLADKFGLVVGTEAVVHDGPIERGVVCSSVQGTSPTTGQGTGSQGTLVEPRCSQAPVAMPPGLTVVGIFNAPGGDVDDVSLAALTTDALQLLTEGTGYDRIDIKAADGVDIEGLLDRISATLPEGLIVVPGSVAGTAQQIRNELEIQRAYHWLLSTDLNKRLQSNEAPSRPENGDRWAENEWQAIDTEMRVSRVTFVDSDTAIATYAIYYMAHRSSLAPDPFTGLVVRVDGMWKLSAQDICQLSAIQGPGCDSPPEQDPANFVVPPDGWSLPASAPEAVAAFRVLADPTATVDARVAAVQDGPALGAEVATGLADDAARAGGVAFNVEAARLVDADHAQILYSLVANGEPLLETPYPLVASAVRVDGVWRAARRYACGLTALAGTACNLPSASVITTTPLAPTTSTTQP